MNITIHHILVIFPVCMLGVHPCTTGDGVSLLPRPTADTVTRLPHPLETGTDSYRTDLHHPTLTHPTTTVIGLAHNSIIFSLLFLMYH